MPSESGNLKPESLIAKKAEMEYGIRALEGEDLENLLKPLKSVNSSQTEVCLRFVVTKDLNTYLTNTVHRLVWAKLKEKYLIDDGQILYYPASQKLRFRYFRDMTITPDMKKTGEYSENNLKGFLKSQGVKISDFA